MLFEIPVFLLIAWYATTEDKFTIWYELIKKKN